MTKRFSIGAAAIVVAAALVTAPSAEQPPGRPDGRLVLGLHPPERVVVMDVRSGRTVSRPLPGGTLCHGEVSLIAGRVVFAGSVKGRGAEMSLGLGLKGRPRPIGLAELATRSARPGRLWLGRVQHGRSGARLRSLREVTVHGRTTFVARRLPPAVKWFNLEAALEDGLAITSGRRLRIWDPRTGAVVRTMPEGYVVGHDERRIAWCRGDCRRVHVTSPGGDITLRSPGAPRTGVLSRPTDLNSRCQR